MSSKPDRGRTATDGLLWNLGSVALPLVGSFLVSVFLAPYLGDEAWGRYSLVMSAATLLLIVAKFGVHSATSRLITEHESLAGAWLRAGLQLRGMFTLSIAVVALAISPLIARSFGVTDSAGAFWLVAPIVITASAYEFAGEVLIGLRSFAPLFFNRLLFLALRLAAVLAVRLGEWGAAAFLAGHALAQSVPATLLLARLLHRYRSPPSHQPARTLRRTFELSVPLAFSSASYLIYSHTDRLMLGWFSGDAVVGQFSVARNVLDASLFPVTAVAWSLRPALVKAVAHGTPAETERRLAEGIRLSFLYAVAAPAILLVLGPRLLTGLYTAVYDPAGRLLLWMLPILFLRGLGAVIFPALLALDAQKSYARLMAWTAAINVAANLLLIPRLGAEGAVLATVLSLLPLVAGGFLVLRRELGSLPIGRHWIRHAVALGSSAVVAALCRWLLPPDAGLPLLLSAGLLSTLLLLALNLGPSIRRGR